MVYQQNVPFESEHPSIVRFAHVEQEKIYMHGKTKFSRTCVEFI